MSAATWLIIAIVGFSLSGIALITAIILFIKLDIPGVIGDLSGKTVAREIKAMRDANAINTDRLRKANQVNVSKGRSAEKLDENENENAVVDTSYMAKVYASKRLDRFDSSSSRIGRTGEKRATTTESLSGNICEVEYNEQDGYSTDVLDTSNQTDSLNSDNATELLNTDNRTEVLSEVNPTEILNTGNQTEILNAGNQTEILDAGNQTAILDAGDQTAILDAGDQTAILDTGDQTAILDGGDQTAILDAGEQTAILDAENQTEILSDTDYAPEGTTVLSESSEPVMNRTRAVSFVVTRSNVVIHSDEVIK